MIGGMQEWHAAVQAMHDAQSAVDLADPNDPGALDAALLCFEAARRRLDGLYRQAKQEALSA